MVRRCLLPRTGVWCSRHKVNRRRHKSLLKLCRTYRRPIYGYVRRHSRRRRSYSELFRIIVERKDLNSVRKEKGRLRSYLLASVKHFFAGESPHAMALKRGKGQRLIPFDDIRGGGAHRSGTLRSAQGRPNPRTALGLYGIGASDGTIA